MELNHLSDRTLHSIPKTNPCPSLHLLQDRILRKPHFRRRLASVRACAIGLPTTLEQPGGKMVVELVGAFNELTKRMNMSVLSTSSSRLLFKTLKLRIPILQAFPISPDGRSPLSRALSAAVILADLQVWIVSPNLIHGLVFEEWKTLVNSFKEGSKYNITSHAQL